MKCNRGLPLRVTLKGLSFAPTHGYSDKGFLRNRFKNVGVLRMSESWGYCWRSRAVLSERTLPRTPTASKPPNQRPYTASIPACINMAAHKVIA